MQLPKIGSHMRWLLYVVVTILSLVWLGINFAAGLGRSFGKESGGSSNRGILGWSHDELLIALPILCAAISVVLLVISRLADGKGVKIVLAIIPAIILAGSFTTMSRISKQNARIDAIQYKNWLDSGLKKLEKYPRHYIYSSSQHEELAAQYYIPTIPPYGCVYMVIHWTNDGVDILPIGRLDGKHLTIGLKSDSEAEAEKEKAKLLKYYSKFFDNNKKSFVDQFKIKFMTHFENGTCK